MKFPFTKRSKMTFMYERKPAFLPFWILLLSVLAFLSTRCYALSPDIQYEGLMCDDHPASDPTWMPVLVRSWVFDRLTSADREQEVYLPRYTKHAYAPPEDPSSIKYVGLDMFFMAGKTRNSNFRMYFQRDVKVYMLVAIDAKDYDRTKVASLPGWEQEGWAERSGDPTITYGIHFQLTKPMPMFVYVFSRVSEDKYIDFPQTGLIKSKIEGIPTEGAFNVLIAEKDGSRSPTVGSFRGTTIEPNTPCPSELHDTWRTVDNNPDDIQTQGMTFSTWHPTWDPCHWCAYDHDHGSSPKHIFGYEPKYNYPALKNGNENEPHQGFKGVVFETKDHFVYYNIHAQTSSLRRVTGRFHTIHLVIADKAAGEILVDIAHKGDFGFQSVRVKPGNRFMPISELDKEIMDNQTTVRTFRSIAVIDVNNLVEEYEYRSPVLLGNYEEWQTMPICASSRERNHAFRFIFKEPATGIKSLAEPKTRVDLGGLLRGQFVKSPNLIRLLILPPIEISDVHCPEKRNGFFYTDASGKASDGPSESSLRQYVQPGFSVTLRGKFEPEEPWVGIHGHHKRGTFINHGYGLDPDIN